MSLTIGTGIRVHKGKTHALYGERFALALAFLIRRLPIDNGKTWVQGEEATDRSLPTLSIATPFA